MAPAASQKWTLYAGMLPKKDGTLRSDDKKIRCPQQGAADPTGTGFWVCVAKYPAGSRTITFTATLKKFESDGLHWIRWVGEASHCGQVQEKTSQCTVEFEGEAGQPYQMGVILQVDR